MRVVRRGDNSPGSLLGTCALGGPLACQCHAAVFPSGAVLGRKLSFPEGLYRCHSPSYKEANFVGSL